MNNSLKARAKQCCAKEYKKLIQKLESCDMKSKTSEDRHFCYQLAAKVSGRQSKACIAASAN